MQSFFSPAGIAALETLAGRRPLLAFDFDGTLAPIVDEPDAARVPPELTACLAALEARVPVAIISGRSVADVRARLEFEPRWVIGSHGAEDPLSARPATQAALDAARSRLRVHDAALRRARVSVEDKGYSIALHYRQATDAKEAMAAIDATLEPLGDDVARFGGKAVVNLTGPAAPDKADALALLMARAGTSTALFAGDDVNDEPAFARLAAPSIALRVGGDEAGSRAMYRLDDHEALLAALLRLSTLLP